jgi:transposase
MTQYSFAATVKAMKIQEVILKAASGEILWIDAADIIGVSYRTMKRWKSNYEEFGYDGIFDRRMKTPSPKSAPLSEIHVRFDRDVLAVTPADVQRVARTYFTPENRTVLTIRPGRAQQ